MTPQDIKFALIADDRFSRVFGSLKREITDAVSGAGDLAGRFGALAGPIGALTGGAGLAALGVKFRQLVNDIDALNDASDAIGDTIENISALEDVARRNGEGLDLVSAALNKLNKTLGEARADSPVAQLLRDIGLSAEELRSQAPSEALRQVAVALAGFENDAAKARAQQELFGKSSREVASFLNDLAAAGELNATVTARQAAEAERLNKELAQLATETDNAARSLSGAIVPALNDSINRFREARKEFGLLGAFVELSPLGTLRGRATEVAEGVEGLTRRVRELKQQRDALVADQRPLVRGGNAAALAELDRQIAKASQLEQFYRRIFAAEAPDLGQSDPRELARRGRGPATLPSLPDRTEGDRGRSNAAATAAAVTEAERYIDALTRQLDKTQELTAVQQAGLDIARGLQGLGTKVAQADLIALAQRIDLQKALNDAKQREADLQKLISGQAQSDVNDALASIQNTRGGRQNAIQAEVEKIVAFTRRLEEGNPMIALAQERVQALRDEFGRLDIERQIDQLERFARTLPAGSAGQRRAAADIEALRAQLRTLPGTTDPLRSEFDRLADAVQGFADNTIDAFVDLAAGGEFSAKRLYDAFRRDVLKELVEDPIRDSMKTVVKSIRDELAKVGEGGNPLQGLLRWFQGLGGSGGSGGGDWLGSLAGLFGGFGTRAMGGDVRAGQLYRWRENGREWFVPTEDGTVVTQRQVAAAAPSAAAGDTFHIHVNGDVSPQTVALVRRMIDEQMARADRRQRYGA